MIRILIILILFLSKSTPSFSQKKLLPNGDDYYHSYTKVNDTVRIYDIGDNLVREAYPPSHDISATLAHFCEVCLIFFSICNAIHNL